jgi:hypothetical protein
MRSGLAAKPQSIAVSTRGTVTWPFSSTAASFDTARLRRVVELVAEKADWDRKLPLRHGLGIAVRRVIG